MLAANAEPARAAPHAESVPLLRRHRPVGRVLFFGKNMSRTRCTGALVDGLRRHGLSVKWQNYSTVRRWLKRPALARGWVRSTFRGFRPDLVMVFCRDLPLDLMVEMRCEVPVVLWVEEAMHDITPEQIDYLRHADLVCTSDPSRIPFLRDQGVANVAFLMSGFSARYHHPERRSGPWQRDVVFIGGPGAHGQRADFLAQVSSRFDTEIFGLGWEPWRDRYPQLRVQGPVRARGFRALCATSRIVLGLNQFNDDALYFSNRTWLSLACRGFHLTHYVPGLETVLQDGQHLAWYHDAQECLAKIAYYLAHDEERTRIAEAGCRLAHDEHQYYHRIGRILAILRGEATAADLQPRLELIPRGAIQPMHAGNGSARNGHSQRH